MQPAIANSLPEADQVSAGCADRGVSRLCPRSVEKQLQSEMANLLPFRDINIHSSNAHYAFTSPSNPSAPTLVIDRPSGDIRLVDGTLLGAKRVSSIAGILGIIKLKLGRSILWHAAL